MMFLHFSQNLCIFLKSFANLVSLLKILEFFCKSCKSFANTYVTYLLQIFHTFCKPFANCLQICCKSFANHVQILYKSCETLLKIFCESVANLKKIFCKMQKYSCFIPRYLDLSMLVLMYLTRNSFNIFEIIIFVIWNPLYCLVGLLLDFFGTFSLLSICTVECGHKLLFLFYCSSTFPVSIEKCSLGKVTKVLFFDVK